MPLGHGVEVDVALFAAYPHARYQLGREAHKPAVGIVVGGAGFATHLGGDVVGRTAQAVAGAAVDHVEQHRQDAVVAFFGDDFGLYGSELADDVAVGVADG